MKVLPKVPYFARLGAVRDPLPPTVSSLLFAHHLMKRDNFFSMRLIEICDFTISGHTARYPLAGNLRVVAIAGGDFWPTVTDPGEEEIDLHAQLPFF